MASCSNEAPASTLDFDGDALAEADARYPVDYGYSRVSQLIEGTGDNRWQREVSVGTATAACMRAAGYDYPDVRWTREQIVTDWIQPRHVALTSESAASQGYGPPPTFSPPPTTDTVDLAGEALAQYKDRELDCVVQAFDGAFADYDRYEATREQVEAKVTEFESAFVAANPVQELMSAWAECMHDRGYDYSTPEEARAAAWQLAEAADAREIAVADAACREHTDYDDTWWSLYSSAEARFLLDNETLIVDLYESGRAASASTPDS